MRVPVAALALLVPSLGLAAEPDTGTDRLISTAADPVPPRFRIWTDEAYEAFIKPVIQVSSSVVLYRPITDRDNVEYTERVSTLLLSRIGFEGSLFGFLDFRTLFERNLGFQLTPNGPTGTSVWEGNASWQARENYLRLHHAGLSLTAGIAPDPATVDYVSNHVLDSFGMDPFVRDPLLISGFSQGQSVLLRWAPAGSFDFARNVEGLTLGVGLTSGNPLVSSLSVGFGGEVNRLGSIFDNPRRAINNGLPGSNIQMTVLTPSLSYERDFGPVELGARFAGQWYWVDPDITQREDAQLRGTNFRGTVLLSTLDGNIRLFGSAALRENDNADLDDATRLSDEVFYSELLSGGLDIGFAFLDVPVLENLGFGGSYYRIYRRLSEADPDAMNEDLRVPDDFVFHYVNVGLTYTLFPEVLYTGFRYSRFMAEASREGSAPVIHTANNFILSLRLVI